MYDITVFTADGQRTVGSVHITSDATAAEVRLPVRGEYEVRVRPLFTYAGRGYKDISLLSVGVSGMDLQLSNRVLGFVHVTEIAPFTVLDKPLELRAQPEDTSAAIYRITLNDHVLYQAPADAMAGAFRSVLLDPATMADGLYRLQVEARDLSSGGRTVTYREFVVDQVDAYRDLPHAHWAHQSVELLSHKGILNGRDAGLFAPGEPILRKEFAKMLALTLGLPAAQSGTPPTFADAPGDWSQSAIDALAAAGLMEGEAVDGQRYFRPERMITRAEASAVVGRALGIDKADLTGYPQVFPDTTAIPNWARSAVTVLYLRKWLNGFEDGSFGPGQNLLRGQAAKLLANYFDRSAADDAGPPATMAGADGLLWRSGVNPSLGTGRVAPTPGNGLLFTAGSDGHVYALLPASGQLVWQTAVTADGTLPGSLAYDPARNQVYTTADSAHAGKVIALNASTGRVVWQTAVTGQWSFADNTPVVEGARMFVAGMGFGSTLYALDTATGRLVWQRDVGGLSSPVVAGGRIFVANTHGQVFAFRSADGVPLWQHKDGYSGGATVGVNGRWVYTNDWEVGLSVFDAASGKPIGWAGGTRGTVAGGRVWKEYAGGYRVFDAATGTELGQAGIGCAGQVVGQTHAFAVCHDEIYSIDLKNYAVKSLAPGTGPVVLDGNRLYYTYVDSATQEPRVAAMIVTP